MSKAQRPNIVVFVSHDTGRHISPYGISTVKTPNAERLAGEGVLFENSFCTSPGCCPSRAGLFSGRSPHSAGMYGQAGALSDAFRFDPDVTHAAQHFKNLGYETMLLGLAHEVAGSLCPGSYFDGIGFDILEPSQGVRAGSLDTKVPAILDKRTEMDKPFYLQIGTKETHTPYLTDGIEPFDELGVTIPEFSIFGDSKAVREEYAAIQGEVNRLDEGLGHVLDLLDERGLADNTIMVFTTDHGLDLTREKTTLYDRGIGVFLIMRFPGAFEPGQSFDGLVSNIDVLPTLIEAAGGSPSDEIEGRSFFRNLTEGSENKRERLFAEKTYHGGTYDPMRCVRTERYKYIFNFESVRSQKINVTSESIKQEYRHILDNSPDRFDELYDLEADPQEANNLAEDPQWQEVRQGLAGELVRWMEETNDPLLEGPVGSGGFYKRLDWLKEHVEG